MITSSIERICSDGMISPSCVRNQMLNHSPLVGTTLSSERAAGATTSWRPFSSMASRRPMIESIGWLTDAAISATSLFLSSCVNTRPDTAG